jgi:hypothetical protein
VLTPAQVTVNTEDWATQRSVHTLRQVLRAEGRPSVADQFSLTKRCARVGDGRGTLTAARRFVDALAEAPAELRSEMDVYQLWLEVCHLRDEVLRRDLGTVSILLLLLGRTAGLALLLPLAAPVLALHLPIVVAAAGAGRITVDKEVVSTLKLATAAILTMLLYAALALAVGARRGWRAAAAVLAVLPACGIAALRVVDAAMSASRALPSLWRLLWLRQEAPAIRRIRGLLQDHARALLQHHNQSGTETPRSRL